LLAELNNIIRNKDDEITDLKNLVYRFSDDMEKLIQALQDADVQLMECMTQIREMTTTKEQNKRELEELKGAAQVVVDMVDPLEEWVVSNKMLLERLRETPKKFLVMYQRSPRPTWSTS
jgi:chromosome segregation ATPase